MTRSLALLTLGLVLLAAAAHATPVPAPPVVVPYYGATYGTPGGFTAAEAKRVVELLESIDRRLEQIAERQTGGPVPLKKGPDLHAAAKVDCARCHTPGLADAKGGGFILFGDDKAAALKPLSGREKARATEAVQSGAMPPDKKLPADRKAVYKW